MTIQHIYLKTNNASKWAHMYTQKVYGSNWYPVADGNWIPIWNHIPIVP